MKIKIEKNSDGFAVKFPFELKDSFKSAFPSSKWDSLKKQWQVGIRSGKRLEEWSVLNGDVASELETANAEREAALLNEAEIEKINHEINKLRAKIANMRELTDDIKKDSGSLKVAQALLNKLNIDLVQAESDKDCAQKAKQEAMDEVRSKVNKIIDIQAVLDAQKKMTALAKKITAEDRKCYEAQQAIIEKQYELLKSHGFKSKGMQKLVFFSFRRPDRDVPASVTLTDIYTHIED